MMNYKIDSKQLIILLLALFIGQNCFAETKGAPYSEKFQDYLKHEGNWDGFVPNPLLVNHSHTELRSGQLLPEVYDLRDLDGKNYISSIKNQGPYGTCWSFATLAAIESVWSKNGLGDYNLSVRNMANCHGFELTSTQGGNHQMSTAYLTRMNGPVSNRVDPYSDMAEQSCRKVDASEIPYYVTAAYYTEQDIDKTKQLVYKYGGVAASMSASTLSKNINPNDATYFYDGDALINHAVTIVGWNDTLIVTGGASGSAPEKGAWIVKNAYGTQFGDKGYFYASYYDANLGSDNVCYPEFIEKSEIDTLLMYDKFGPVSSRGYITSASGSTAYALIRYEIDEPMFVNRVGFFFNSGNGYADIYVGTSFDGTSLQDTIASKKNYFITYPGYQSVEVPALINTGDLYILIKYKTPDYSYPIPIETRIPYYCEPEIQAKGYQWISYNGKRWDAVGEGTGNNFDLCIRAYARRPEDDVLAFFEAKKRSCCKGDTAQLDYYVQGNPDSLIWILNNRDTTSVARIAAGEEAPKWVLEKDGVYSISLIAYNQTSSDTITQTNCIEVAGSPALVTMLSKNTSYVAKGKPLTISAEGAETYKWSCFDNNEIHWGNSLTFNPMLDSCYIKVDGYLGSCQVADSVLVRSVTVDYDDVKSAYPLSYNKTEGPFSNFYATVEDNEPAPEQGDCEDQQHWCKEGGVQNSIWFTFEGPASGEVTIESHGFDNQLALYELSGQDDNSQYVLSDDEYSFELIAANDDAHSDYSAALYNVTDLEGGKTYYLQMDGSAGGEMGEATIVLSTPLVASVREQLPFVMTLEGDNLLLEVTLANQSKGQVKVFDAIGRIVDIDALPQGTSSLRYVLRKHAFYIVQVEIDQKVYSEKILVQ